MRPLGDRLLIRPESTEEVRESGLVLPNTVKREKPQRGQVLLVGPDVDTNEETGIPQGSSVIYSKYGGLVIEVVPQGEEAAEEMIILREGDVLAVL